MEPSDLLRLAAGTLERLGIQYLVTGSMASIAYGEPRFTNDIDIVAGGYGGCAVVARGALVARSVVL